jgi:hypothetical protein
MADKVGGDQPVVEEIQPDKEGKYPETIPYTKYVGIKEAWGKAKEKVASLEEQLKSAVSAEEHKKVKEELDTTKTKLQETSTTLNTVKEQTLSEKRNELVKRGIPEDKVKAMSEKELDSVGSVLATLKPKPDLGGGGGSGEAPKRPRERIQAGFESLHPTSK